MKQLFHVCANLHRMGAHDMDRSLLIMISYLMGASVCKIYENLAEKKLPENIILQILFDVYFLIKVFQGTWSLDVADFPQKLEFKRNFQSLAMKYKAKVIFLFKFQQIDPIDLTVYDAHLQSNAENFFQKHIVLLGPLMMFSYKTPIM